MKRVLILLIGEVLEDPRVLRTATSLAGAGVSVTVACTNPSGRPSEETAHGFNIIRFRHRREFIVKRLYLALKSVLHPSVGGALGRGHENAPSSGFLSACKNKILKMNFRYYIKDSRAICREMTGLFSDNRFDLVHANDIDTLEAGVALKRAGVAKALLYDAHEYWGGIGVHGSVANDAIRDIERAGTADADFVVTVNELIAGRMKDEYGLKCIPSVVMNCPRVYDGPVAVDHVNSPVRVIYQGVLQAFRGLDELIMAFKYIDNAELTLSGFGPLEDSLKRLADSLGLGDRVVFKGRFMPNERLAILAEHDIGVMSFRDVTENIRLTSPNKMFDYAMTGLATAAADLPFLRKTVLGHDVGQLFDEISPECIAATLNAMIDDREALVRYKRNARALAETEFSWDRQFDAHYPWP